MKALYRRYRSTSLAEVVGQEAIVSALEKSLKSGKLHHAYLFSGARGTGKTSVARILAHEANGFKYELEAVHPDIIEIDAASNTGVDNIRELIERAALAPTSGKYKIYIIDEVHMLSKSAFNALLKTLEEPPTSVIFILATTDPEKVPITIMSRVQHFKFGLADTAVLAAHLRNIADKEKIKISDAALDFLAESGAGSFRDALSLLEQANAVCGGKAEISREALEAAFGVPNLSNISNLLEAFNGGDTDATIMILDKGIGNQKAFIEGLARQILKKPTASTLVLLDDLINTLKNPAIEAGLQVRLVFLRHMQLGVLSPGASPSPSSSNEEPGGGGPTGHHPSINDSPSTVREVVGSHEADEPGEVASEDHSEADKPRTSRGRPVSTGSDDGVSEEVSSSGSPIDAGELKWDDVLSTIKQSDIGLWAVLAKRQIKIEGDSVKVFAEKQLWANKLENADNFAKISRLIAPRTLVVTIEKAPPSETAKKVSAILGVDAGELREVEVPDGI